MGEHHHGIEITEAYRGFSPPLSVRRTVDDLLSRVPDKYLGGLRTVVLTNAGALTGSRKRSRTRARGQRIPVNRCRGLYHQRWDNEPAWIELFVDNILAGWPPWLLWMPFVRDTVIGETLFHEIGHHVHFNKVPEHREREDVADRWKRQIARTVMRRKYWYLVPFLAVLGPVLKRLTRSRFQRG
jgi:hypothetical protein